MKISVFHPGAAVHNQLFTGSLLFHHALKKLRTSPVRVGSGPLLVMKQGISIMPS
ncbi:hypothetical protein CBFG_02508 [Clostridiales bacterium 1_7_47FAA]|uniref:hypothetical protein n=1 Tax=Enterocloster hominis (ex Hitch et al. 2024) TaxID=1917870 RepID=UPI00019795B3|nr:hypothetical protein [Lachnoclostridium pacaense]EEQ58798.1 hypothetical protein CBFG_02508 [Clostridiales bacterium 1_7_47FAA]MCC2817434.1 hypothetical protein [Lachnoclostridium pacaense]